MPIMTIDEQNFDSDVTAASEPVLIDFWAEWCGPCKAITPTLDEIAAEFADRIRIGKVNIDDNPALASRFGVRSIPALALLKGGEVIDLKTGAAPKSRIVAWIEDKIGDRRANPAADTAAG